MIAIVGGQDSCAYSIVQYVGELVPAQPLCIPQVDREETIQRLQQVKPSRILICSRMLARGKDITKAVLEKYSETTPILGINAGHQFIAQFYGGGLERREPVHGKAARIFHDNRTLFRDISQGFIAGCYYSSLVSKIPENFEVSAATHEGHVMAIRHFKFPVEGLQFNPESILTSCGKELLRAFLCPSR
jgi:para-aminobenzoate synthetase component II